jgi:hypothetical protein
LTFKDLKKRVTLEAAQQQSKLFETLQDKPFWIWDLRHHKLKDIRTDGVAALTILLAYQKRMDMINHFTTTRK